MKTTTKKVIMNHSKDFSARTRSLLSSKGISVVGTQAVPAWDGDTCFSGVAYMLSYNGQGFLRTHSQVVCLAQSSWSPEMDTL